jgi:hypothetical protein
MPRTIDLIRASKLPSNMMQFAAKGALSVPADENIEILVYLARHNKVFGDLARMTLAGWDEKASLAAASNPQTTAEVLGYLVAAENLRPNLLPALLENPSVPEASIAKLAISATRDCIEIMLQSARVRGSAAVLKSLRSNPYLKPAEAATVDELLKPAAPPAPAQKAINTMQAVPAVETAQAVSGENTGSSGTQDVFNDGADVPDETVSAYISENAAEIAAEQNKPFQAVGGVLDLTLGDHAAAEENEVPVTANTNEKPAASSGASAAAAVARPKPVAAAKPAAVRENTLQKINRLDVKGRIQLALKGNKEERSILIRDGTKVVALAVLEAPKLADGEVEKFALQKNVLEAVLRQIPLKRRFMKNYIVVRNLVSNPRTPLDLGLGLMKHLLIQDLKNISANKEVSETVRKLALKMYKQKLDATNKK